MTEKPTQEASEQAPAEHAGPAGPADAPPTGTGDAVSGRRGPRRKLLGSGFWTTVGAFVLAFLIGAVLIIVSDEYTRSTWTYFFAAPADALRASWDIVSEAYAGMFTRAVFDPSAASLGGMLSPLTETLLRSTPLILAGLGVAAAFKAGLFNIGAQGQMYVGAALAGFLGFWADLPVVLHLVVAVLGGIVAGAVWGGLAGVLKARTGAHEVITTIMLNYVAQFGVLYLLGLELFQRPGQGTGRSPVVASTAELPTLFGSRMNLGLALALAAAVLFWWLFERTTVGFSLRAVGANPSASRTAGINTGRATVIAMAFAGALAGLGGATVVLGEIHYLTASTTAGIGFTAITVALLGRATAVGTVAAAILFGAMDAGAIGLERAAQVPGDIVLILQALIVLFVAAPALVKSVLRIREESRGIAAPEAKGWSA